MWKPILTLTLVPLFLVGAQPIKVDARAVVSLAAQIAIERDYLEWVHLPRWAGDCVDTPIVGVTWIEPEGVVGKRPVLWLKERATGRYGAILGLTESRLRSMGQRVPAEPVIVLRQVTIYRLCRPWSAGY